MPHFGGRQRSVRGASLASMSVDYLRMYQAQMAHQAARTVLSDPQWREGMEFPEVSFPPVIILTGGNILSGRIAGPDGYHARMRNLVRSAPGSDLKVVEGLLALFPANSVFTRAQLRSDEPVYFEHLYLVDVRSYQSGHTINLPGLTIRFDAIDGWSLGELGA